MIRRIRLSVSVKNAGSDTIAVTLEVRDLVDEFKCVGENRKIVSVAGGKAEAVEFQIASSPGAFAALYPVHVYANFESAGKKQTIHCVQIFETAFVPKKSSAEAPAVVRVPADGAVSLTEVRSQQVLWQYFDKPMVSQPVGWRGSVESSGASFDIYDITRGTTKKSLVMHPTWRGGAGTIFVQYKVQIAGYETDCVFVFQRHSRYHSARTAQRRRDLPRLGWREGRI